MPLILLPLAFLALPLLEIGVFIWVGSHIGVGWTLALVILSVVLGAFLLKRQTLSTLNAARTEARAGRVPERQIVHGAMIALAGILLVVPGFVTDVVGLLLFLPPVRDLIWRSLRARITVVNVGGRAGRYAKRPAGPEIVDLGGAEFSRRGDDASPWSQLGDSTPGTNNPERPDKPTLH